MSRKQLRPIGVPREDLFDALWERLAAEGGCDGRGGMEYRRVRREWEEAGRPEPILPFIRRRANLAF